MEVMIETCCGIDVHQKSIVCCILDGPLDTNNTNPWSLIGLCLACTENWMNKSHEITRIRLERENKITRSLLFHCSRLE
ncbi:transposase [Streptococcus varani]|uniref:Transposase n=1 Tax=Streptococcus varani TaxID=1608583 RepID=A0A0E4H715_9STRE|nr:hypothetical protein [Streptococcus varani]CQR24175.1 transposase [Streptococcus varani]